MADSASPDTTLKLDPTKLAIGDYNPYPGHPLLVIMEVLHYYPDLDEAFADPNKNGSRNRNHTVAIGDSRIHGAGSNVANGLHILNNYRNGEYDLNAVYSKANEYWVKCIQGQSPSPLDQALVPGMVLAQSLWPMIRSRLNSL